MLNSSIDAFGEARKSCKLYLQPVFLAMRAAPFRGQAAESARSYSNLGTFVCKSQLLLMPGSTSKEEFVAGGHVLFVRQVPNQQRDRNE